MVELLDGRLTVGFPELLDGRPMVGFPNGVFEELVGW